MLSYFVPHKLIYIIGDMNSRFGDIDTNSRSKYKTNPDTSTNQNGMKL